jgi:hypothetical protein
VAVKDSLKQSIGIFIATVSPRIRHGRSTPHSCITFGLHPYFLKVAFYLKLSAFNISFVSFNFRKPPIVRSFLSCTYPEKYYDLCGLLAVQPYITAWVAASDCTSAAYLPDLPG